MHCDWHRSEASELENPAVQWQRKPFTWSSQLPPFSHAASGAKLWHSSMFAAQLKPSQPSTHAQV
jgi:hypothetical protein